MLYCGVSEIEEGMTVAASVFHPSRPQTELLAAGVTLDRRLLKRLRSLGVTHVWVEHDLTRDLDRLINVAPSPTLRKAFDQIKGDFAAAARTTITAGRVQEYRQTVMELVCELIANRGLSGLTERLMAGPASLFTHCANVAYLSISMGIELETYIVTQRPHMTHEHARDMTALGVGAMLHDLGKTTLEPPLQDRHETDPLTGTSRGATGESEADERLMEQYREHTWAGYQMLRESRVPASARQVVWSHHQHWDGRGFPDVSRATQNRYTGTQRGEQIHIFSRIVAAANALDNLIQITSRPGGTGGIGGTGQATQAVNSAGAPGGARGRRCMAAALHAFAGEQFEGWFDPVVRDRVLRRVPPFAVGSRVVLSDGRAAVVVAPSLDQPCRPTVRLLDASPRLGAAEGALTLDLQDQPKLFIDQCGGESVREYYYEMAHDPSSAAAA